MAEMKGIKLCGECGNYDWKRHKCKIGCNDDSNAQSSFYGDCPLPDVVPKSEVESINPIQEAIEQKKKENKESVLGVLNELLDEKDAEIKRLKAENKTLQGELVIWKQDRFNLYQRLELYKIAREKVAMEIFEEIENRAFGFGTCFVEMTRTTFDEIKKKHTESEDKP